jgi:cytochrome c oxidase subunit 3
MHPSETLNNKQAGVGTHPLRFILWLMIISSTMAFAAFTSAYIVRRGEGNWLDIDLPQSMLISTCIVLLSSVTMQLAHYFARRDEISRVRIFLIITFVLGVVFLFSQLHVWNQLVQDKIYFGGNGSNPAGSFIYVLMGFHGAHILAGLIFLAKTFSKTLQYKIHSRSMLPIGNCTIFWHFLGGLWLYLYLFLLLNH